MEKIFLVIAIFRYIPSLRDEWEGSILWVSPEKFVPQVVGHEVVSQDEDVPTIFGDRFILKLHGDFKHNNFVLKEEDYLNYSENFKLIETLVKSIFPPTPLFL